jgi:DNA end-binding protein Ku
VAPRPYWKGYLKLSLVSCPIALYPATSAAERVSFNQINRNTGNRIRYKKVDAETEEPVEQADIVKGYPIEKNVYVTLDEEELEALQVESTHTIEIDKFVPRKQLDERYYDSPYYVVPDDTVGQDAFAVIRDAMKGKGMVGLGRVVLSKRERPIILEPYGKGLRAMTLRYPYEVRDEKEYFDEIPDVKIPPEMLKLAEHILDTKAADFEPSKFVDTYETAVIDLLRKKQTGNAVATSAKSAKPAQNSNIIDMLKRSLEMEKKGKIKSPSIVPHAPKVKKKVRA